VERGGIWGPNSRGTLPLNFSETQHPLFSSSRNMRIDKNDHCYLAFNLFQVHSKQDNLVSSEFLNTNTIRLTKFKISTLRPNHWIPGKGQRKCKTKPRTYRRTKSSCQISTHYLPEASLTFMEIILQEFTTDKLTSEIAFWASDSE
jgi:hypothetical protein